MTKELVIDVNKSEWGDSYPDFLRTYSYVDFPIFTKFMDAYDKNAPLPDELKEEMRDHLEKYAEARGLSGVGGIIVLDSKGIALEKILAVSLEATEIGENYKEKADVIFKEIDQELGHLREVDLRTRWGVAVDVDGKKIHLHQDNIQELLPELSGEQCGAILNMAHQNMVGDAGMVVLAEAGIVKDEDGFPDMDVSKSVTASKDGDDLFASVTIKDGKVLLSSTQNFDVRQGVEQTGKVQSSMIIDITNLKGPEFKPGRATGTVDMQVGFKSLDGDNQDLFARVASKIANPDQAVSYDDKRFHAQVSEIREGFNGFQKLAKEEGTKEKNSQTKLWVQGKCFMI